MNKTLTKRSTNTVAPVRVILERLPRRLARANLKLTPKGLRELEITIRHIHARIRSVEQFVARRPPAAHIRASYRSVDQAIKELEFALTHARKLGKYRLPDDALQMIGLSVSDSILAKTARRRPRRSAARVGPDDLAFIFTAEERHAIGLTHGPELLIRFLRQIHGPLTKWLVADRKNKGGRPTDLCRKLLIEELVGSANETLGVSPLTRNSPRFTRLCECVNDIFRLQESNFQTFLRRTINTMKSKDQSDS